MWEGSPRLAGTSTSCSLPLVCRCWAKNTRGRLGLYPGGAAASETAGVTPLWALQGLGALSGTVLAECREFVAEAWCVQQLLGGGMRQVGALVAAAHLGLQHMEVMLRRDHDNARHFVEGTSGPLTGLGCNSTPGTAQQYHGTGGLGTVPRWPHWVSSQVRMLLGSSPGWTARIMP